MDLTIRPGERVALLGANGAGKSTLLMVMAGLLTATGSVRVCGEAVAPRGTGFRRHLGVVFQDPNDQLFCPTIFDDVAFGPRNMGLPRDQIASRVHDALTAVGLHGFESRSPLHLSLGERKRAAIATVLSMRPSILLMDEPTSGLDPRGSREIVDLVLGLCETEGKTLICATHDLHLVQRFANRAVLLNQGKIVADSPTGDLLKNHQLLLDSGMA